MASLERLMSCVKSILAVCFLALLAWALHAPLQAEGQVPRDQGGPVDATLMVWNAWWLEEAINTGQNPWVTDQLSSPRGENLALFPLAVPGLAVMNTLSGPDAGAHERLESLQRFGIISCLAVGLAGLGLGHALGLTGWSRLLLGVMLMTVEMRMANIVRMHVMMTETIVLFAWMAVRWNASPTAWRALWTSTAFVLLFLSSFEYAYYVFLLAAPFLLWRLVKGVRQQETRQTKPNPD